MNDKIEKVKLLQSEYKMLIDKNIESLKIARNAYLIEDLHNEQMVYQHKYNAIIEVLRILEEN